MTALNNIKDVIKPLVKGLEMELDEEFEMKSDAIDLKSIKSEDGRTNGVTN